MITLIIQLPSPGHRFSVFYSVAFVAALLLLLYEGYRRKFPMLRWILMVSFSQILFITGTKMFALSHDEWETMLKNLVLVPTYKKELFGGLLMLGAMLYFSQSPFDLKNQLQFSVALRYVWGENSVTLRAPALK
jgi:hypothetical protein